MPRVASLYLPNLSTDRLKASEKEGRREGSSPAFRGRGGTQAEGLGGEGLADSAVQTLTSHRFAMGPSSPVKTGEGREDGREPCSCPSGGHWRPGARWARNPNSSPAFAGEGDQAKPGGGASGERTPPPSFGRSPSPA